MESKEQQHGETCRNCHHFYHGGALAGDLYRHWCEIKDKYNALYDVGWCEYYLKEYTGE